MKTTKLWKGLLIVAMVTFTLLLACGDDPDPKVTLLRLEVTNPPDKTEYIVGEFLNLEGLEVQAVYSNNKRETLTSEEYIATPDDGERLDNSDITEVTIWWEYRQTTVPITVSPTLQIQTGPTKRNYIVGERLDLTGMVVRINHAFPISWQILSLADYTAEPAHDSILNEAGTFTITVTYEGQTATTTTAQSITVVAKAVQSISITKFPDKITYNTGETFDPAGMELTKTYNTGDVEPVTTYEWEPKTPFAADDDAAILAAEFGGVITISAEGLTTELPLKIKQTTLPVVNIIGGINSHASTGAATDTQLDFWNRAHWTDFGNGAANLDVAPVEGTDGTLRALTFTGGETLKMRHDMLRLSTPDGIDNIGAGSGQSANIGDSVNNVVYRYTVDIQANGLFSLQLFSAHNVQPDGTTTGAHAIILARNETDDGFNLRTTGTSLGPSANNEVIAKISDSDYDFNKTGFNRFDFVMVRQRPGDSNFVTLVFYINSYRLYWENVNMALHPNASLVSGNFRFPVNPPNYGHRFCVVPAEGVVVTLKELPTE